MDTIGLRIAAVAASMLEGFSPSGWSALPEADAKRVLLRDGERTLVASVWPADAEAAASAERFASEALAPLLSRAPYSLPAVRASRSIDGALVGSDTSATLMLSEPMPGSPLSTDMFAAQPSLVASLAEAVALLHSADPGPLADAGLVVEESAEMRERLLDDLDTAAGSGKVPARLLQRWESALEDVSAWRFLPVPVHANLGPDALWAQDGAISALGELSRLRVGDPAADIAAVSSMLSPEEFESFFRTYRRTRGTEDAGLRARVGFHSEITVLEWLLAAMAAQDDRAVEDAAALLDALADVTVSTDEELAAPGDADAQDGPGSQPETRDGSTIADDPLTPPGSQEGSDDGLEPEDDGPERNDGLEPEDEAGAGVDPEHRPSPERDTGSPRPSGSFRPSASPAFEEDGITTERLETYEFGREEH